MGVNATQPERAGMAEFSDYFENTWICGCYSAASWNVHDLGDCRTNNHIEGWHKTQEGGREGTPERVRTGAHLQTGAGCNRREAGPTAIPNCTMHEYTE